LNLKERMDGRKDRKKEGREVKGELTSSKREEFIKKEQ
jgi:hypothetical protein